MTAKEYVLGNYPKSVCKELGSGIGGFSNITYFFVINSFDNSIIGSGENEAKAWLNSKLEIDIKNKQ